jgi:hypothetical protein
MTEGIDELLDYLQKAGLNTVCVNSPAWGLLHNKKVDKTMNEETKKIIDKTIKPKTGQKMTVGVLVQHRTVPQLGLGVVVAESEKHKGYWHVKWCDERYQDVGSMGIEEGYLEIL